MSALAGEVGLDVAGVTASGVGGDVGIEAGGVRQHDVEHLALAGIIRAIEVAGAKLDADDALRGNALKQVVSRVSDFVLGRRAVDHDIAGGPGEAADIDAGGRGAVAKVELEARNVLDDVVGGARRILGEKGGVIDGGPAILRRRWRGRLRRQSGRTGDQRGRRSAAECANPQERPL